MTKYMNLSAKTAIFMISIVVATDIVKEVSETARFCLDTN